MFSNFWKSDTPYNSHPLYCFTQSDTFRMSGRLGESVQPVKCHQKTHKTKKFKYGCGSQRADQPKGETLASQLPPSIGAQFLCPAEIAA